MRDTHRSERKPDQCQQYLRNLTHLVFRNWCRCCVAMRSGEQPHHQVRSEDGTSEVKMDWMIFTSQQRLPPSKPQSTTIHEPCKLCWRLWRLVDTRALSCMQTANRPHVQWSGWLLQLKNIALCHEMDHLIPIRAKARWKRALESTEARSLPASFG